ncbi:MAG: hypothetical protein ISS59_01040 [Desulfobacteraceae bacterium]|nr:hypothetical protein [Desulfobacteraceae bacterium]
MKLVVKNFKEFEKSTLRAFVAFELTEIGLEIRDCTLHEKNGKRWIGLPAKPYIKNEKTLYSYIVAFSDKKDWEHFQRGALAAIDCHLKKVGRP